MKYQDSLILIISFLHPVNPVEFLGTQEEIQDVQDEVQEIYKIRWNIEAWILSYPDHLFS